MALDLPYDSPLACGTVLDDLIAQVTDGAAPLNRAHQATCEFCQAALEAIRRAWEEFQELARAAVAVPDDLAERVIRRVRELSDAEAAGVLVAEGRGQTHVAELVVFRSARAAALTVPGVAWASVAAGDGGDSALGELAIRVALVVAWDVSMPVLAQTVRQRVTEVVRAQTGAVIDRVDVAVRDVTAPVANF